MDPVHRRVAERLRQLRSARGLSLEEVAAAAGVSRGTLSQIETLKTNPTIGLLWKIATGLGVPFSELLGGDPPVSSVRVLRAAKARRLASADGRYRSRPLLGGLSGAHRVEQYELGLDPGAVEQAEPHAAGSLEQLYVISGRLALAVAGEQHALGPGDAVVFAADLPHRYECLGTRPFVGLSLILYRP